MFIRIIFRYDLSSFIIYCLQTDTDWVVDEEFSDQDETLSVADVAQPYWQKRAGPTFWCHIDARHPSIQHFFSNVQWLHPAVSVALLDEKRLISDRMKHLLYEVLFLLFFVFLLILLTSSRTF